MESYEKHNLLMRYRSRSLHGGEIGKFPLLPREWELHEDPAILLFILDINHTTGSKSSDSEFTACCFSSTAQLPG
jgi:hypothetical protein